VDDVETLIHSNPTRGDRFLVNYKAEAEGVAVEQVVDRLLEHVPRP
jgi:MoxR-like ATPase